MQNTETAQRSWTAGFQCVPWFQLRAPNLLRISLGIIYLHFGYLKFYPELSPAESLASQTIVELSGHLLDASTSLWLLAIFETAIGLGFLFNVMPRTVFVLFTLHMIGTFTPLILLTDSAYTIAPLAPTLEGQYILKNIVFLAAGWSVLMPDAFGASTSDGAASPPPATTRHQAC